MTVIDKINSYVGNVVGGMTVLAYAGTKYKKPCVWRQCACGRVDRVPWYPLKTGNFKGCVDCYNKKKSKHGEGRPGKRTPEYKAWQTMLDRASSTHACSDDVQRLYRDRGISVCDEWKSDFVAFLNHVGRKPSPKHSLDRINNDRGYEPGNVRWATTAEQAKNRRSRNQYTGKIGLDAALAKESSDAKAE